MRKRNWKKYNGSLIQRGRINLFLDLESLKVEQKKGAMGRPRLFSDALIYTLMLIKIQYHLPYRALQGFAESLMKMAGVKMPMPDYTSICRRARKLKLPKLSSKRPCVVAIDASGVKVYGEGEWKVKIHGKSKRRKWLKVHIAIDVKTGEIVAELTTPSNVHDAKALKALLDQVHGNVKEVLADGAYDGQDARDLIRKKKALALVPPPSNAVCHGNDPNRDGAIKIIKGLGGDKEARSLWGKLVGYSKRALAETAFSRMKRMLGAQLFSRNVDSQRVENILRCALLNRMNQAAA